MVARPRGKRDSGVNAAVARQCRPARVRRLIAPLVLPPASLPLSSARVDAAIHEKAGAICANGQGHLLVPPRRPRAGGTSFQRALQESGLYELRIGVEPDGIPNPRALTIESDFEARPANV